MKIIAGRRDVLRTFALTMAASAIGVASAAARPAATAVESALTPPGAAHLDTLMQRLAQAPRRREFKPNTLIIEQKAAASDPANYEDPAGVFSGADNSMPVLMRRGVVFMCCHNAIWEQAAALIKADVNPDKLSHGALAAELTNHLVDGVVLIPGARGTMLELQQVGFHYA